MDYLEIFYGPITIALLYDISCDKGIMLATSFWKVNWRWLTGEICIRSFYNIELDRLYLQRTISHQRPWLILQGNTSTPGKSKKSLCRGANDACQDFFYCAFAYFRCLRKHNRVRGNEIKHLASELTIRTTVPKHFNTKYPRGIFLIV